jgi:hypothetical protein
MGHTLRYAILATSLLSMMFLASGAQQLPPVPSKVLPTAQPDTAAARTLRSPITGRTYSIRVEPKEIDSDAVESADIARNETTQKSLPQILERRKAAKKAVLEKNAVKKKAATPPPPANVPTSEFYHGTDRAVAKLTFSDSPTESIDDLGDLIPTLPAKTAMVNHTPRITRDADSDRVAEENRNVRVRCWLYASSRESDNDRHLILGRAPGLAPEKYMTMEVSGLPPTDSDSFPQLFAARKSYNDFFGTNQPGTGYDFYHPPIPVIVEGSVFFDITHARGTPPGPVSLRPNMPVIWEVHPVTKIEFEPTS